MPARRRMPVKPAGWPSRQLGERQAPRRPAPRKAPLSEVVVSECAPPCTIMSWFQLGHGVQHGIRARDWSQASWAQFAARTTSSNPPRYFAPRIALSSRSALEWANSRACSQMVPTLELSTRPRRTSPCPERSISTTLLPPGGAPTLHTHTGTPISKYLCVSTEGPGPEEGASPTPTGEHTVSLPLNRRPLARPIGSPPALGRTRAADVGGIFVRNGGYSRRHPLLRCSRTIGAVNQILSAEARRASLRQGSYPVPARRFSGYLRWRPGRPPRSEAKL